MLQGLREDYHRLVMKEKKRVAKEALRTTHTTGKALHNIGRKTKTQRKLLKAASKAENSLSQAHKDAKINAGSAFQFSIISRCGYLDELQQTS